MLKLSLKTRPIQIPDSIFYEKIRRHIHSFTQLNNVIDGFFVKKCLYIILYYWPMCRRLLLISSQRWWLFQFIVVVDVTCNL